MDKDIKLLFEAYQKIIKNQVPIEYGKYSGYDHIHWTIINAAPLDKEMGRSTLIGPNKFWKDGQVYLVGRASDGKHYKLKGPLTPEEYLELKHQPEDVIP